MNTISQFFSGNSVLIDKTTAFQRANPTASVADVKKFGLEALSEQLHTELQQTNPKCDQSRLSKLLLKGVKKADKTNAATIAASVREYVSCRLYPSDLASSGEGDDSVNPEEELLARIQEGVKTVPYQREVTVMVTAGAIAKAKGLQYTNQMIYEIMKKPEWDKKQELWKLKPSSCPAGSSYRFVASQADRSSTVIIFDDIVHHNKTDNFKKYRSQPCSNTQAG